MFKLKQILTIVTVLMFTGCVHAQQQKLGGTGGAGGVTVFQAHGNSKVKITRNSLPGVVVGGGYSQTLTATHGTTPYTWSISVGSLPDGLSLNTSTGVISGTTTTVGNFVFTVLVTDSSSPTPQTDSKQLSIAVTCTPLAIVSNPTLPLATVGTAYSFQFNSSGGQGSITWSESGLSDFLLSSGGALTGTPTLSQTQSFTVTATDSCPLVAQTAQQTATLATNSTVQIVTPSPLPDGVAGIAYSTTLAAQGGTAPYTWAVSTGTLPTGLSLSGGGALTGTPTVSGTFSFTLQVTDSGALVSTAPFTLTVGCPALSISTASLPLGRQNVAYSAMVIAAGGYSTLTWIATGLPNGLSIDDTGLISGTPTVTGTFNPVITVTDSCTTPQSAAVTLPLTVSSGLAITTSATLPAGVVGVPYTATMTATGGTTPYQWTVPSGPFTPGAEDIIDWMVMKLPDRTTFHLTGGLAPKYFKLDGGVIWQMKSNNGNPWDLNLYDDTYVYLSATDNNDASQQAACQAAGFTSCFVDPFAYKQSLQPKPFTPRYFVPGTTITILTPPVLQGGSQVNGFHRTTNCLVDNQPIVYLGNVKTITSGGITPVAWGGDVGTQPTIETDYYYSGDVSGTYQNRERFYFVKPFGWVAWDHGTLSGGVYVIDQTSINNLKVAGGAPTPNFGCKVPTLPLNGTLPPGVTSSAAPEMNIASNTGVISGTPTTAGTTTFTVQVEDSVGTITQQQESMTITCPAFTLNSTSPLPTATFGTPYSFQFSSSGGVAPITWARVAGTGSIPPGLTLSSTGLLSGTPTTTGVFQFVAQGLDSCLPNPSSVQNTFQINVQANQGPLAISSTSPLATGTEGVAYNNQITATGGTTPYTFAVTIGSLPAGLSLSSAGVLTGTPTTAGTSTFTVRVTDALSVTATKQFTLAIVCPPLTILSVTPLPAGTRTQAYSFQFTSSGGFGAKTWTRIAGTLPTGLTLTSGGLLSGTPTVAATSSITIGVTDSCSPTHQTVQGVFSITINNTTSTLKVTTNSLPGGTEGVAYSSQVNASGGTVPYTWAVTVGSLPTGLSLSSAGAITGTPTAAGTFSFTVRVTDNVAATATKALSIVITCPALAISSTSPLPNGTQSVVYSNFQFTSTGGAGAKTWSITSGSLPTGLSLNSAGLLSGTPSVSGAFTISVRVTDSCSPTPQTVNKSFTVNIVPALTITTTSPLQSGTEKQVYSITFGAVGGTPPYTWTLSAGTLPTGLTLSSAGVLSGTPTATFAGSFTVRVTDAAAGTTTKAFSLTITCPSLTITTGATLPTGAQNQPYSFQFASAGGILPITWTASGVPTGLSLSTSGALTGTPTGGGTSSISVTATDSCLASHQTVNKSVSLTVTAAPPPLVITSTSPLPAGTQGVAYSVSMAATGGTPPYTWSTTGGSFPAGLSINAAGVISGTPTTIGTSTATIKVTDSAAATASGSFSITISCVPLAITSGLTLPTGTQSQAYSDQLTSSGGTGAKTWSLVSGAFPTGVSISSAGLISGTPSTTGTFTPHITVTDACSTPQTATGTFSLTINPATVPLQITTPTPLPAATISTAYSVTLSATGGTPPYSSWTVTVGSLPTGLSLGASTGIISGTPSVAGTSAFTVRVSDNVAATATKAFSLTVNAASAADNRYCTSASAVTGLPKDGPANPLQNCINTSSANTPSPGSVVNVTGGSCSSLQSAVNAAVAGVTIKVPVGLYSPCAITLAANGNASNWITLETSSTTNLPAEGTRISPAWIGIPSLHLACPSPSTNTECGRPAYSQPAVAGTYLPTIVSNGPTITISGSFWRLIGLHVTTTNGVNTSQVIQQSVAGSHIILDRMVVNGGNSATGQDRDNIQAAVRFIACASCAVIDSYIYDTHCVANGTCTDSQAVFVGGSTASLDGPIKVVNNYLETSGEEIISGGGGVGTTTLPASDLEIRRNHFFKPLFWKADDPSYFGTSFLIKNQLEFKNTSRALIEGNIMEQEWAGQSDQHGVSVLFDSRNQNITYTGTASSSGNTLTWLTGTQFKSDIVASTCAPGGCHVVFNGVQCVATSFISVTQITVNCPGSGGGGGITNNWVQVPTPAGATHIRYFDFNPTNNHWYLADRVSGFWISTNQGAGWTQINTGISPTTAWAINWDSAHSQLIAGIQNGSTSTKFYRSTNEGVSWTAMTVPNVPASSGSAPAYSGFALMPNGTLIDGGFFDGSGTCGSWTSANAGVTNTTSSCPANSPVSAPGGAFSYLYNPIDTVLWLGTETAGLYCSTNSGSTFIPATVPFTGSAPRVGNIDGLSYDANGIMVFAAQGGVWKLNSTGCSLHTLTNTLVNSSSANGRTVGRDSTNALYWGHSVDTVFSSAVYQSTDNGVTWNIFSNGLPSTAFPEAWEFKQNTTDGQMYVNLQNGTGNTGVIYRTTGSGSPGQPPQLPSAAFSAAEPGLNPSANTTDVTFRYNRISHSTVGLQVSNPPSDNGDLSLGGSDISVHDIVLDDIDGPRWATSSGACCVWGDVFQVQNFEPNFIHDISIWHVTGLSTVSTSTNTNQGGFALTGNQAITGSQIGNFRFYDNILTGGVITGGSTQCPNTGVARTEIICWTPAAQLCFDNNFFAIATTPSSGTGSFSLNNPPYPSGTDNGFCPYGASLGTTQAANFTTYQFTNLNGAVNGNYQLQVGSPYHNLASDGTDPGVNWPALQNFTAGVQ